MATWTKITKQLENGTEVQMQAPLIVSASRSTDIPAFYADWFFHRLQVGHSAWTNPFNGVKSYVCYDNTRFIVFWSKNPEPILPYLHILEERDIKCYFQYTLNDYLAEGLEKVPSLEKRIDTFKRLSERMTSWEGKGAVVWRFDPLILACGLTVDALLEKIQNIGNQLKGYTKKLVFSYADIALYKKVENNLRKNNIPYQEWTVQQMDEFARKLAEMNKLEGWNFQLATCGEKIDIGKYNIAHNRCIDGDLITKLAWQDKELMDFMKVKIEDMPPPTLFEPTPSMPEGAILLPNGHYFISRHKKDPGQRPLCECMAAKDIGEYNTCPHLCEYCYANSTKQLALENWKQHQLNKFSETITGK